MRENTKNSVFRHFSRSDEVMEVKITEKRKKGWLYFYIVIDMITIIIANIIIIFIIVNTTTAFLCWILFLLF